MADDGDLQGNLVLFEFREVVALISLAVDDNQRIRIPGPESLCFIDIPECVLLPVSLFCSVEIGNVFTDCPPAGDLVGGRDDFNRTQLIQKVEDSAESSPEIEAVSYICDEGDEDDFEDLLFIRKKYRKLIACDHPVVGAGYPLVFTVVGDVQAIAFFPSRLDRRQV